MPKPKLPFNSPDNVLRLPVATSLKHRIPWLILGLGGGMLTASIISGFEKVLTQHLVLAAFIPLIVYMADAVGTQMEAFIIRDMATKKNFRFHKYFIRQLLIVLAMGAIIGAILYCASLLWQGSFKLSLVLFLSLFGAIISSMITGLVIPYMFNSFRFDPANASGPIATIIQDLLSVLIYFSIASWLL